VIAAPPGNLRQPPRYLSASVLADGLLMPATGESRKSSERPVQLQIQNEVER
jgi:hypothetical protein